MDITPPHITTAAMATMPAASDAVCHLVERPDAYQDLIGNLATWFRRAAATPHSEVEAKIGTWQDGRFTSVVPPELFFQKLNQCHAAPPGVWQSVVTEDSVTFLFSGGVRGTQYSDRNPEFVRKVRQSHLDMAVAAPCDAAALTHFRLSHNLELPCETPCEQARWVRIRRRTSFSYKYWRFDFTYVKQAATRAAAMRAPMQHEIELEVVRMQPDEGDDFEYLATSTLLKVEDMLAAASSSRDAAAALQAVHRAPLTLLQERAFDASGGGIDPDDPLV